MGKCWQYNVKRFDSEPMYNEQYIKTELNSFGDKISIHFHDQRIPTFNCVCLSVI